MRILHTPFAIATGGREIFIRKLTENYPDKVTEHRGLTEGDTPGVVYNDGVLLHLPCDTFARQVFQVPPNVQ
jgi:hypothetical protein